MAAKLVPPFTEETARQKVQRAEDMWNTRDPAKVALAYTEDCTWRNRDVFVKGRADIIKFLTGKWEKELDYKLKKTLFCFNGNRIAVDFQYEYHDAAGNWHRAYGLEHWIFNEEGIMVNRETSINEIDIKESERKNK
eukprot:Phypoly_transcript_23876.p1 GENE.Phypoly_transcript_23876~~Phypoly_transcript_23876.p1  ORF type:complete len:137 (+),score=25.61 Phypoly_transcript_23876:100-510(+)